MTSIEQLKQELLTQKSAIETKGGVVNVANANPSPAEITAGINSISIPNFSTATATEEDVVKGKTFYATNNTLKTGTLEAFTATELEILFNNSSATPIATKLNYYVPQNTTKIRDYFMCQSQSTLDIYFNNELQEIGDHAFQDCPNIRFKNFTEATNLHTIGERGLQGDTSIDLTNIPSCITNLKSYAFADVLTKGKSLIIPANVTEYGNFTFGVSITNKRIFCDNVDFSHFTNSTLGNGLLCGVICDCDFTTPSTITTVSQYFNYLGSFNNITITANVTQLSPYCFGTKTAEPAETNKLSTVTFLSETPPTCGMQPFGDRSSRAKSKFYVPDQSVEAYKTKANLSYYSAYFYPMSQKP